MSGRGVKVVIALFAAWVFCMCSRSAFAITIVKPVIPPSGPITAVTDGQNCNLYNSGHYAVAAGTGLPYIWSINPPGAAVMYDVDGLCHVIRFMPSQSWARQNGYVSFTMTVQDTGDGTTASMTVYPISLYFTEGGSMDRMVNGPATADAGPAGDAKQHWRYLGIEVAGIAPVDTLSMRAYHSGGQGVLTVNEFDMNPNWVSSGAGCGYASWKFNCPQNVTSSWDGVRGKLYKISILGNVVSTHMQDIEIDIGIDQSPFTMGCADGLGASMRYTVVEVDVTLEDMTESEEDDSGEILLIEQGEASGSTVSAVIQRVKPDDMLNYAMHVEIVDEAGNNKAVVDLLDGQTVLNAPVDVSANGELVKNYSLRAKSKSDGFLDYRLRGRLFYGGSEVGGESCRDSAYFTIGEFEVTSPEKEANGAITTAVNDDQGYGPGNEFLFSDAQAGEARVQWRMKIEPDVEDFREQLEGRLTYGLSSVGDSDIYYFTGQNFGTESQELEYDDDEDSPGWKGVAVVSGLPSQYTGFGSKTCQVALTRNHGGVAMIAQIHRQIEVFYRAAAGNHPNGGDPNWFFYYKQNAGGGDYVYGGAGTTSSTANGGESSILLRDDIMDRDDFLHTVTDAGGYIVTDAAEHHAEWKYYPTFVASLEHERQHALYEVTGGASDNDDDGDLLEDVRESGLKFRSGLPVANKFSARDNGNGACGYPAADMDDGEVWAKKVDYDAAAGADKSHDYAVVIVNNSRAGSRWGK